VKGANVVQVYGGRKNRRKKKKIGGGWGGGGGFRGLRNAGEVGKNHKMSREKIPERVSDWSSGCVAMREVA